MKSKYKAPDREDLYTMQIFFKDELDPRGFSRVNWHRVSMKSETEKYWLIGKMKNRYPNFTHANVYGGVSGKFYEQIK
jgi:hypothetical protein